jgi:hypothetical protein
MKQLRKDERGIGHFLLAFLIVAALAAIGIVGYRVMHKDKTTADKTAASKSISDQASCMKIYHDKTLCTFAVNNAELSNLSYTAVDNSVDSEGQTSQITIKGDGKGNTSIDSKTGNQTYYAITIGNTIYVNSNNGGWIKYASNAPEVTNPTNKFKADFSTSSTPKDKQIKYKNLGKEKCGNDTCVKYQVLDPTAAGTNYIWINTSTNRLVRWTSKSADGTNDLAITYGSVTVTAPAGATDAGDATSADTQYQMQAAQQAAQNSPN